MSKPNFQAMTLNELRKYVLAHRDDKEAWDEFAARPRPNSVMVSADTPVEGNPSQMAVMMESAM